jgi:hypothetical protein
VYSMFSFLSNSEDLIVNFDIHLYLEQTHHFAES